MAFIIRIGDFITANCTVSKVHKTMEILKTSQAAQLAFIKFPILGIKLCSFSKIYSYNNKNFQNLTDCTAFFKKISHVLCRNMTHDDPPINLKSSYFPILFCAMHAYSPPSSGFMLEMFT